MDVGGNMNFIIGDYSTTFSYQIVFWEKRKYMVKGMSPYQKRKLEYFTKNKWWRNVTNYLKKFEVVRIEKEEKKGCEQLELFQIKYIRG
jgi:hypothetical protein